MNSDSLISSDSLKTSTLLLGIWSHLRPHRRIQLCLLLVVMLASGAAELLSLGAVLPFLAVLSAPEQLWEQPLVQSFAKYFGLVSPTELLFPTTIIFAVTAVSAAIIRLSNLWLNGRLAAAIGSELSCTAYERTLYQPYEVHVQRNSSAVITGTTTQIGLTVVSINSLLQLITSTVVASALLLGLLLIDAQLALTSAALFGCAYLLVAIYSRRELRRNSYRIAEALTQQVRALQEGLGAIRDVLLDGTQPTYLEIYRQADRPQRRLEAKNRFLSAFPRYALEALGIVVIIFLGAFLVSQRGSASSAIPLLGALALGAQRLLPALQQMYSGWAELKAHNADIKAVLDMLNQPLPQKINGSNLFNFCDGICLKKLHFQYSSKGPEVLKGLDLSIRRGERIGVVGSTGSGKSTLADVLMGLLIPTSGSLLIDGKDIHDTSRPDLLLAWRSLIAHVPQSIYLADGSFAENIAFGVSSVDIDMQRVREAAGQAQISGFIESTSQGYGSFVGERGIRLSGGQRQRIGIARALYKKAEVLVFDEATSALDSATELAVMHSVMEAVEELSKDLTIVMIAHRLSTLEQCDRIISLKNGVVDFQGPPNQVIGEIKS